MKSMMGADDFYVKFKTLNWSGKDNTVDYFSVPGLMFLSDLILQAVEKAGLEAAKVVIRVGEHGSTTYNDRISIAYPSPRTTIVSDIKVEGANLQMIRRGKSRWREGDTDKIPLADPKLVDRVAQIIAQSLPKNSKYAKK